MTATSTPLRELTWQEFLDLPEDPALRHAELIHGEVVVTAPSALNRRVVGQLLSPTTRRLDTVRKRNDYARIGVRELWLVATDPVEALIARAPDGTAGPVLVDADDVDRDGDLSSPLLAGFAVRLGDLVER